MINILAVTALILISGLLAGCKIPEAACGWASQEIVIDGLRSEWKDMPFNYFEDKDIVLGLSNNNDNLYVFFSFKNEQWERIIRTSGLTLWFDGEGKKKKDWGIRYRGGPEVPENPRGDRRDRMSGFAETDQEKGVQFIIIDGRNEQELNVDTNGVDGPAVGSTLTNDIFTYEFRIPLAVGGADLYQFAAGPGEKICIGSEWGNLDKEAMKGMRDGMGGRPGGGGGRPGDGMPPGGGGRGGMRGGKQMPEKHEIWLKATLATAATMEHDPDN